MKCLGWVEHDFVVGSPITRCRGARDLNSWVLAENDCPSSLRRRGKQDVDLFAEVLSAGNHKLRLVRL